MKLESIKKWAFVIILGFTEQTGAEENKRLVDQRAATRTKQAKLLVDNHNEIDIWSEQVQALIHEFFSLQLYLASFVFFILSHISFWKYLEHMVWLHCILFLEKSSLRLKHACNSVRTL